MTDKVEVHPKDLVDCWHDDERMNFLLSAFPSKQSDNPHHWDTKMKFWATLIHDMADSVPHAYVTWDNLFSKLRRNGKEPLGLSTVFTSLVENSEMVRLEQYMQDLLSDSTWVGWGVKWCVKKPASWVVDKVMSPAKSNPSKIMKNGKLVCVGAVNKKCLRFYNRLVEQSSIRNSCDYHFLNIVSYTEACEIAKPFLRDTQSVDIVLETMRKNKTIEIWPVDHGIESTSCGRTEKYVKFAKSYQAKALPFSDAETGIVRLCETKALLEKQISDIYNQISQCVDKAKACLKMRQKEMAKNALKRKRRLQAALVNKEKTLGNQEEILEKLNQCKTDIMVLDTYRLSVAAYKELSEGLDVEEVRRTMDDVSALRNDQSEIADALCDSGHEADLEELENELAALLNSGEESTVEQLCGELNNARLNEMLPNVPNETLEVSPVTDKFQSDKVEVSVE